MAPDVAGDPSLVDLSVYETAPGAEYLQAALADHLDAGRVPTVEAIETWSTEVRVAAYKWAIDPNRTIDNAPSVLADYLSDGGVE